MRGWLCAPPRAAAASPEGLVVDVGAAREQEANHGEMRRHDLRGNASRPVGGPHERRPAPIGIERIDVGATVQEQDGREPLARTHGRVKQVHGLVVDVDPAREEELNDVAPIRLDGPGEESQLYCKPVAKKPRTAASSG